MAERKYEWRYRQNDHHPIYSMEWGEGKLKVVFARIDLGVGIDAGIECQFQVSTATS